MDFGEMFRVLGRRWRISVPGLLLTVMATVGAYVAWPTTYESTAEITLIASQTLATGPGGGNNPYVAVAGLVPMANILASNLSSDQAQQQLNALGVPSTYTAVVPPAAAGPFLTLTVDSKSRLATSQAMPVIITFAEQHLRQLQNNGATRTPDKSLVRAVVIATPSTPTKVLKKKLEVVAGVGILGFVSVLLLSFYAEARAKRRAEKRLEGADGRRRRGGTDKRARSQYGQPDRPRSQYGQPDKQRRPAHTPESARIR
jgi:uncharacterized protein involved in exopolysaccharide biosynthesis